MLTYKVLYKVNIMNSGLENSGYEDKFDIILTPNLEILKDRFNITKEKWWDKVEDEILNIDLSLMKYAEIILLEEDSLMFGFQVTDIPYHAGANLIITDKCKILKQRQNPIKEEEEAPKTVKKSKYRSIYADSYEYSS